MVSAARRRAVPDVAVSGRGRLPDFLIVGAMKSGTSSLYQWLAAEPEFVLPAVKEPHFFSRDEVWRRGPDWYRGLFSDEPGLVVGEASTSYTNPDRNHEAARRAASVVPDARLIYVLRQPVERLRSHYRHQVWRGQERRSLLEVLSDPENPLVRRSCYHACIAPFLDAFPREQLCIVRFEDLVSADAPAWPVVLEHLGVAARPAPAGAHNVSAERAHFTRTMGWIWRSRLRALVPKVPRPVRRLGATLLLRKGPEHRERLAGSTVALPDELLAPIWADTDRLERWMGRDQPLWTR